MSKKAEKSASKRQSPKLDKDIYNDELERLQFELVKMQYWIKDQGLRLLVIFEGRDAAGKGGIIKRITQPLQPRGVRVVALPKPSDVERTQWYFQRYTLHLPAAGEIVIFDRSWYNRAGVERVMGFCTDEEYWGFLRSCPQYERMLVESGIILVKYYLSVSREEQERRFQDRAADPTRRWKLSPIDLDARMRWTEYSKAKDLMFQHTDIPEARWFQVEADDKRRARLNIMSHLLEQIDYKNIIPPPIELEAPPPIVDDYERPPRDQHIVIPDHYAEK